jgi:hypothetical protein
VSVQALNIVYEGPMTPYPSDSSCVLLPLPQELLYQALSQTHTINSFTGVIGLADQFFTPNVLNGSKTTRADRPSVHLFQSFIEHLIFTCTSVSPSAWEQH